MIQEKLMVASVTSSASGVWFAITDAVSIAIVTQIGALVLAGLAAYVSWKTHKAVNSRMDEFKVLFAQAKISEGVLLEKNEATVRDAAATVARAEGAAEADRNSAKK